VRIISGRNKGRKIIAPANLPVRPTTDFAKEALFNILGNIIEFEEIEVLDLFAGTGNISYEFISRNVVKAFAVDNNPDCVRFIQQTAKKLNYCNLFVVHADYRSFLKKTEMKWDLIFADPPYEMSEITELPSIIFDKNLLKPNGLFILEHKRSVDFSNHPGFFEHRTYGNVNYSFFLKKSFLEK
jgi:16S rRNA (guanine(966)-N(2))-methyltransferase RsmD